MRSQLGNVVTRVSYSDSPLTRTLLLKYIGRRENLSINHPPTRWVDTCCDKENERTVRGCTHIFTPTILSCLGKYTEILSTPQLNWRKKNNQSPSRYLHDKTIKNEIPKICIALKV
jgi:hypothetical protein